MGDVRVKDRAEDVQDTQNQDAGSRLREDAYNGDLRRTGNDKVSDKPADKPRLVSGNPYFHVQMAGMALREFEALKGKDGKEKVSVSDDKGNIREATVEQRRAELLGIAGTEFKAAITTADRIDQSKIPDKLLEIRHQQSQATDLTRLNELQQLESMVESMKHAPSTVRFAYATFLADRGDLQQAKKYLDEVAQLDPEARLDDTYKQFAQAVETGLRGGADQPAQGDANLIQQQAALGDSIATAITQAEEKRKSGDTAAAEAAYRQAVELAERLDQRQIIAQLQAIEQAKKDNAGNAQALSELGRMEKGFASLLHAPAMTKIYYADFLVEQKRYDDAKLMLEKAARQDPDLVKDNAEFAQRAYRAHHQGQEPKPFENPFVHLSNVEKALNDKDLDKARKELEAAVRAADTIDRKKMRTDKRAIDEVLKETSGAGIRQKLEAFPNLREAMKDTPDAELRKKLAEVREFYDAFDHASAFTRVALARFEIANKNFNQAQALIADVERFDPELTQKPEIEWEKLKEAAQEPSTWEKVWGFTKDVLKELACDAVAVLAGVGAGLGIGALTSLSGPGAVAAGIGAGAVAGSGAYTFMKCVVFGEEFHWSMPLWGALDGASGGAAAAVRSGLVSVGGRMVSKEFAEATVLQAGGSVVALDGLEGLKMAQTAQTLAKQGLKTMAKDLPLSTRLASRIPLLNTGNAQYRAALNGYRGLAWANRGVSAGINVGTAATGSIIYRGGHEGVKYANGEHKTFGDFAKAYGMAVVGDTVTGATFAGRATGAPLSSLWAGSTVRAWELGLGSIQAIGTYEQVNKALEDLQKPAPPEEAKRRYFYVPGTDKYPYSSR